MLRAVSFTLFFCCGTTDAFMESVNLSIKRFATFHLSPANINYFDVLLIFFCIFALLQEIEKAHHTLLKTLREPSVNQESEDQQCHSATVSRTPSLDRGSGDGGGGTDFAS